MMHTALYFIQNSAIKVEDNSSLFSFQTLICIKSKNPREIETVISHWKLIHYLYFKSLMQTIVYSLSSYQQYIA